MNYSAKSIVFDAAYAVPAYPLVALRDLETLVQYGSSGLASEQEVGFPMLRMNNLQANGWDLSDLKYIELTEREAETYRLCIGDILFNRTNSKELVGKCEVFEEEGHWVFASYLVRVRVDPTRAIPDFVAAFISTRAGRIQVDRVSRQIIGMTNINAQEIRDLVVPLPPLQVQQRLVSELTRSRSTFREKMDEADRLLTSLDAFLLEQLELSHPEPDARLAYAMPMRHVFGSKQIGADYFHPERLKALEAIQQAGRARLVRKLEDIAEFHRDGTQEFEPTDYLGLANVQSNTGELADTTEEPGKGLAFQFAEDDVLFARLRPYLNKVWHADHSGVCSTEFHVMRIKDEQRSSILPSYLAAVLRSSVVLAQTRHMMTGNTHPRLTNDDVVDLLVPIPDMGLQKAIIEEIERRRLDARGLRIEAADALDKGRERFEAQLLAVEGVS